MQYPEFPVFIIFNSDKDTWILHDKSEIETNLEWFNSDEKDTNITCIDNQGRPLRIKVEKFNIVTLELE